MKRCPECRRDYYDDALSFCLDDGTRLVDGPAVEDGPATAILPATKRSGESPTKLEIKTTNETALEGASATDTMGSRATNSPSSAEYIVGEIKRHKSVAAVAAIIILAALAGSAYLIIKNRGPATATSSLNQGPPADLKIQRITGSGKVSRAAISPDGKFLAYVQNDAGEQSLSVKQVSTNSNVQIVAPAVMEGYYGLVFQPDGEYVYFSGINKDNPIGTIFRVPTLGGSITKIVSNAWDTTVSPDGKQIAFGRWDNNSTETSLFIVNADGTNERKLASLLGNRFISGSCSWSPDGKVIACGVGNDESAEHHQTVATIMVADGTLRELSEYKWDGIDSVVWLSDMSGIIFSADDTGGGEGISKLWEMSYPAGESRRLTQDLTDYSRITITGDGKTLVAVESESSNGVWVSPNADPNLAKQITTHKDNAARGIAWTPDERIVYVSMMSGKTEVWVMNSDGTNAKQLTNDGRIKYTPVVSADGRYIVYGTSQGGAGLWRIDIDGGNPILLTRKGSDEANPDISPDGKWIVYSSWVLGKQTLWKMSIEGGDPTQLTQFSSTEPHVSPDGKLIACFYRDEKQSWRIAVVPFEGGEPLKTFDIPQTVNLDMTAKWTPNGRGITYINGGGGGRNLWLQPYPDGPPKQMTDFKANGLHRREWTRDGKQVALVRGDSTNDVVMITNFR